MRAKSFLLFCWELSGSPVESFSDGIDRILKEGTATPEIESSVARSPERSPIREKQPGLLFEELAWVRDSRGVEVQPGEIGGLHVGNDYLAELLATEGSE